MPTFFQLPNRVTPKRASAAYFSAKNRSPALEVASDLSIPHSPIELLVFRQLAQPNGQMATSGRYETVSFEAPGRHFCHPFTVPVNNRLRHVTDTSVASNATSRNGQVGFLVACPSSEHLAQQAFWRSRIWASYSSFVTTTRPNSSLNHKS